jgi:hypothetical protein
MRCIAAALSTVTITLMTAGLTAQTKPSFAGKWIMESASNGRDGLGRELTITQEANTLTIEYITIGENPVSSKLVYTVDGNENTNTITGRAGQTKVVSKATWSANTLVITTTRATGEHKRTLNLESGNLVIEASTSGFGPMPTKIIYKKGT